MFKCLVFGVVHYIKPLAKDSLSGYLRIILGVRIRVLGLFEFEVWTF